MMSERAHSIIFAVLWRAAVVFGTMVLVTAVWAHDKHHPELSAWFRIACQFAGYAMLRRQ